MTSTLILCRSLTHAQRSSRLLERSGITNAVIKAPQELRTNGCGYSLRLYRHADDALYLLRKNDLLQGKVYREENGRYTEITP